MPLWACRKSNFGSKVWLEGFRWEKALETRSCILRLKNIIGRRTAASHGFQCLSLVRLGDSMASYGPVRSSQTAKSLEQNASSAFKGRLAKTNSPTFTTRI